MVLERLDRRIIIDGIIETKMPLHIGTGEKDEVRDIDMPIQRYPGGLPYIPGSSFKGAVRSEMERIARSLGFTICVGGAGGRPEYRCMEPGCVSCAIFGSLGFASRTIFRDAPIVPTSGEIAFSRPGVALHRETRTVVHGPFKVEGVRAGVTFNMEVIVENPEDWMLGFLFTAFDSLTGLGGQATRGMGKIDIKVSHITLLTTKGLLEGKAETYEAQSLAEFKKRCMEDLRAKYKELIQRYRPT